MYLLSLVDSIDYIIIIWVILARSITAIFIGQDNS